MRIPAYICLLLILGTPLAASGEQPLEALQRSIEKGIIVLEDPRYQGDSNRQDQQQKLWEITFQIFDFEDFSRRVLAASWKKFTLQQRKEFVRLFGQFLGKFYLNRLQKKYRDERVIYVSQKMIGSSKALIEIKVLWKDLEIPVTVRMTKGSGTWKAYDLSAFGVSAVNNYRAQFKWILRDKSPEQLIEMLKEKLRKLH